MNINETENWLRGIITQLVALSPDSIVNESKLRDDIGLNSGDIMLLQLQVEEEIGKPLLDSEYLNAWSFGRLVEEVRNAKGEPE